MRIQSINQLILVVVVVIVAPHIQAYWLPTQKLLYTVANPAPRGLLNRETIRKEKTYPGTTYSSHTKMKRQGTTKSHRLSVCGLNLWIGVNA